MINIIPDWLQSAVDFLNRKFPEDENVNMSILYGFDNVGTSENECGFAVYSTETRTIMLADYNELKKLFEDLSWSDIKEVTITNLFHEYRHHQQNIYGWDLGEDDAEEFASNMYKEFISGGDGYDYTDLIGGRHSDGMGWNPNGIFCGECASQTCEDCEQRFINDCTPCCDFCLYSMRELIPVNGKMINGVPIGCFKHSDIEHHKIAESRGCCDDFRLFSNASREKCKYIKE